MRYSHLNLPWIFALNVSVKAMMIDSMKENGLVPSIVDAGVICKFSFLTIKLSNQKE